MLTAVNVGIEMNCLFAWNKTMDVKYEWISWKFLYKSRTSFSASKCLIYFFLFFLNLNAISHDLHGVKSQKKLKMGIRFWFSTQHFVSIWIIILDKINISPWVHTNEA